MFLMIIPCLHDGETVGINKTMRSQLLWAREGNNPFCTKGVCMK